MHFFGMEASSVQLRVGAPVWWQCGSTAVEPALRQVSYARCAQGSTGDCEHFASMQQPADFFCKEIVSERHRLEAPFHSARVVQPAETRRRERRQCGCESCREHQFRPASIKVMQRTFNPLNSER